MTELRTRFLRWIASVLIRGPGAPHVLGDLNERLRRDLARGLSLRHARWWWLADMLGSAFWLWRERVRRSVAGRHFATVSALDVKLAWRMAMKSPWLTVVGVLGIAFGTAIGIGFFVAISGFLHPRLPLDEGDRIVALENRDIETSDAARPSLRDFLNWRSEMRSVRQISAVSIGFRDLVTGDARPRPVRAAAMTASGFHVARVQPLLGRYLSPEDERQSAPPVVVLGYDLWRQYFGGDPAIIGRSILVGPVQHTVVGVMPPGFAFPKNQEVWTALRTDPGLQERGRSPALFVFGRLGPGVTVARAQAELTVIGLRGAAAFPETSARLRPRVLPYTYPLDNVGNVTLWEAAQIQLMAALILIAVTANVSVLVYARTATRQGEIAVRTALGASGGRIVGQLFIEALFLSLFGAGLGLGLAHAALGQLETISDSGGAAFWVDYGLHPASAAFALALAVLCAVIVGVVPALKSTGRRLNVDLRRAGSGASLGLGRAWTALIVAQVAVAVTVLPTALHLGFREIMMGAVRTTFPAHEFLAAGIGLAVPLRTGMDAEDYQRETAARFAVRLPELERRLEAEPAVVGVTFEGNLLDRGSRIEIEGAVEPAKSSTDMVPTSGVAFNYFDLLGARMLAGRNLRSSDAGTGGGVVVNHAFVRQVLDGGSALGRRIRFLPPTDDQHRPDHAPPGPWLDVVGVVEDLQASMFDRAWAPPMVYHAVAPGQLQSATLLVRVRSGDADRFAPRFRRITAALDPGFRLGSVGNLATLRNPRIFAIAVTVVLLILGIVLLLSAAGIHALMSLAVTRRRKEIAVRTALGASPARMLASVFAHAVSQLGLGGLLGSLLGSALLLGGGVGAHTAAVFLGVVVVLMLGAGLTATVGPARRGLGIQPMEALKEE